VACRFDRCADACLVPRRSGVHLPGAPLRSRTGLRYDRTPPGAHRVAGADHAAADAACARSGRTLRRQASRGESVGKEIIEWGNEVLSIPINEVFGQTECNLVLGSNASVMPIKPGSIGRAIPGHVAAIVNDAGEEQPPGTIGNIAFRSPDPVMMLEYWR